MVTSKTIFFLFEMVACYAAVYYSNFLFFYLEDSFGFKALENLLVAALSGLIYTVSSWRGGAFAQKYGCIRSLYVGVFGLITSLVLGLFIHNAFGQIVVFAGWSVAICFVWPALEGAVCKNEDTRLATIIGIYNTIWAGSGAIAYFTAGMLLERLGMRSIFWVPLCLLVVMLCLVTVAMRLSRKEQHVLPHEVKPLSTNESPQAKQFLHMAWIANPLSYVAINTLIPLIPSISSKLGFSTGTAGIVCSLWMFSRLAAFLLLWFWTGWHYRFRWLISSFFLMIVCFIVIIETRSMALLVTAQVFFGMTIGLIYYSSLYYSMNVTEEKGAHGGLHEAMIGAGLCIGPAFGASALFFFPKAINGSIWSVGSLLAIGFVSLIVMKCHKPKHATEERLVGDHSPTDAMETNEVVVKKG